MTNRKIEYWVIPPEADGEFVAHMEEVLEVYERPLSTQEPVICVDEAATLHGDVRDPIPMKPGRVAKQDSEYERCGTANAFCAVEPQAGLHITKITPTRSSPEFACFIESIANRYPEAETIHLVMDNLSTHTRKALVGAFGEEDAGEHGAGADDELAADFRVHGLDGNVGPTGQDGFGGSGHWGSVVR